MGVFILKTVIIAGNKQIGRTDYRFDLIRKADKSEYDAIINHEYLTRLNKYLSYKDGKFFYKDLEIPSSITTASLKNYNDQRHFLTYINGWITQLNTCGESVDLSGLYPLLSDGTCFSTERCDVDEVLQKYWPDISAGVRKEIYKECRKTSTFDIRCLLVPFFGITDTNNQIMILRSIYSTKLVESDKLGNIDTILEKRSDRLLEVFEVKNYHNFIKLIKDDKSWFEHLVSSIVSITNIWENDSSRPIKLFLPLNDMVSQCNLIEKSIALYRIHFEAYNNRYSFFDGLVIEGLTVRIPKTDMDLAIWGHRLSICVGGDTYVNMCRNNTASLLFMLEKDGDPFIMCYYKSDGTRNQTMYAYNKPVKGKLGDTIDEFASSICRMDIPRLFKFIDKAHLDNKTQEYKDKGYIDGNFKKISKMLSKKEDINDQIEYIRKKVDFRDSLPELDTWGMDNIDEMRVQ